MPDNKIVITLPSSLTAEGAFANVGLVAGYKETTTNSSIEELKLSNANLGETHIIKYIEDLQINAGCEIEFIGTNITDEDEVMLYTYRRTEQLLNPISLIEFGKQVWSEKIQEICTDAVVRAARIRLDAQLQSSLAPTVE